MPRILFLCPSETKPFGGIKQIYRQVDILRKLGYDAFVVHEKINFRSNWFINNTSTLYVPLLFSSIKKRCFQYYFTLLKSSILGLFNNQITKIRIDDIIVIPEIWVENLIFFEKNKTIIYNQNSFYTFRKKFILNNQWVYHAYKNSVVLTVSEYSNFFLKHAFPKSVVFKLKNGINVDQFKFSKHKSKKIAFMSRKLSEDSTQIMALIRANVIDFEGWKFVEIDNVSESEVAKIFKESIIFLSFNEQEGLGLPPLEAMASGCIVIGYDGGGGKEYFINGLNFRIENRDVNGFYLKINDVIKKLNNDFRVYDDLRLRASKFVIDNYSFNIEESIAEEIWKEINRIYEIK
jgi:glycosyltransferase involved in cell wall biosynthesis